MKTQVQRKDSGLPLLARAKGRAQLGLRSWSYSNIKEVSHYVFLLIGVRRSQNGVHVISHSRHLYTSDAADEEDSVNLCVLRILKKKK